MAQFTPLHEKDFAAKKVDDLFIAPPIPPFDGEIKFAAGVDNPKRNIAASQFMYGGLPALFLLGQMNVSAEVGRSNGQLQPFAKKLREAVDAMIRRVVTAIDERVV